MMETANPCVHRSTARTGGCSRWFAALLVVLIGTSAWGAEPSLRTRPVLIGMLTYLWGATSDMVAVRDGLVELGNRENEHFALGARHAEGNEKMLAAIVRELVRDGAEIIYASGWKALQAARQVTSDTPIVFTTWYNPPPGGPMESVFPSGGNVTGVVNLFDGVSPKALDAFRSLIPGLKRVQFPYDANDLHLVEQLGTWRRAASRLGIELVERPVRTQEEARQAFVSLRKNEVDGIIPASNRLNITGYALEASSRRQIPTMFPRAWMAEYGGLASYGASWHGLGRQAARLVDMIMKGTDPGEIPVEVHDRMEFVINLRTAKALGLKIAPEVLNQADRLIR